MEDRFMKELNELFTVRKAKDIRESYNNGDITFGMALRLLKDEYELQCAVFNRFGKEN